jgi:hypothetical protein
MAEFGATSIANSRQEEFCKLRANGISQMEAWLRSTPEDQERVGEDTARNSGSRCERYPHVAARILFLQREATKQREVHALESKTPLEWMQEIAHVFRLTADSFSHLSLQKRSKLKSFYATHLVRMAALEDSSAPARQSSNHTPMWQRIAACKCLQ